MREGWSLHQGWRSPRSRVSGRLGGAGAPYCVTPGDPCELTWGRCCQAPVAEGDTQVGTAQQSPGPSYKTFCKNSPRSWTVPSAGSQET